MKRRSAVRSGRFESGTGISAGSGIDFKDIGTNVLKGIPGELRLFAAQS